MHMLNMVLKSFSIFAVIIFFFLSFPQMLSMIFSFHVLHTCLHLWRLSRLSRLSMRLSVRRRFFVVVPPSFASNCCLFLYWTLCRMLQISFLAVSGYQRLGCWFISHIVTIFSYRWIVERTIHLNVGCKQSFPKTVAIVLHFQGWVANRVSPVSRWPMRKSLIVDLLVDQSVGLL